ncbi:hypothetical protein NLU13_8435 [Sarocladium strictum]|uniref:Uncharacterized protein n=1 Tax=Sarocladium strictum TaxID=5046 RepID=A0AA39L4Z5_SARSR|nr:hypothetical protein NLU13_8435 [Sarocladium strictum]
MSLPLKVKLGLRTHWDPPTCPAAKALQKLRDNLGVSLTCNPEWPIIVAELRPIYDERGIDLVASIAGLVHGLCEAVAELVEDETWADALWDKLGDAPRTLSVFPEVPANPLERPRARWDTQRGGIVLDIPRSAIATPLEYVPALQEDLRTAFDAKQDPAQLPEIEDAVLVGSAFQDLSLQPTTTSHPTIQYLPDASSLPRPDELLQQPPYHMIVRSMGEHRLDVECTHSPSLKVLATYLQRWCRTNHNLSTKPPVVDVRLEQGSFGAGVLHDLLTVRAEDGRLARYHVSPTLVLHLAESVLGYERVHTDSCSWQFRRNTAFKMV